MLLSTVISGTVQSAFASLGSSANSGSGRNSDPPQDAHSFRFPIGQIPPSDISKEEYTDPQSSQAATSRLCSPPLVSSEFENSPEKHSVRPSGVTRLLVTAVTTGSRSLQPDSDRDQSGNPTRNKGRTPDVE